MAVPCGNHICSGGAAVHETNVVLVITAALSTTIALLVSITGGCIAAAAAMRQGDAKTEVQMSMEASVAGAFFLSPDGRCCGCGDGSIS